MHEMQGAHESCTPRNLSVAVSTLAAHCFSGRAADPRFEVEHLWCQAGVSSKQCHTVRAPTSIGPFACVTRSCFRTEPSDKWASSHFVNNLIQANHMAIMPSDGYRWHLPGRWLPRPDPMSRAWGSDRSSFLARVPPMADRDRWRFGASSGHCLLNHLSTRVHWDS